MKQAKIMAVCGMMAALSIVLMVLGAAMEIGMYAAPMLAGLCLLPVGRQFGRTYQLTLWLAVSLLAFILVPNVEENLMYLGIFGCYPVIRPLFERVPKMLRPAAKLMYFNVVTILLELLILWVLVPETMTDSILILLLLLGNVMFVAYDRILPRMEDRLNRLLEKILK